MRSTCVTLPKVNGLSSTILASYPGRSGYRYEASTRSIYARMRAQATVILCARAAIFELEPELELARSDERRNVFDWRPLRCQH